MNDEMMPVSSSVLCDIFISIHMFIKDCGGGDGGDRCRSLAGSHVSDASRGLNKSQKENVRDVNARFLERGYRSGSSYVQVVDNM